MFTTIITLTYSNSDINSTEDFESVYQTLLPEDVKQEMDYLRFDMIIDGKCSNKLYSNWDNISKTHRYVFYHESAEDLKACVETYTNNWASIKFQDILNNNGFTVTIDYSGTAPDTRDANKICEVNRYSLGQVRPERRQEVFDSLEENNG